jgi:hypothetical protein
MTTDPTWRTSSYSGGQGNCIEVGNHGSRVLVRDTQDRTGSVLQFTPGAWRRFADRLKAQRPLGGRARERDPASWLGCYVKRGGFAFICCARAWARSFTAQRG